MKPQIQKLTLIVTISHCRDHITLGGIETKSGTQKVEVFLKEMNFAYQAHTNISLVVCDNLPDPDYWHIPPKGLFIYF